MRTERKRMYRPVLGRMVIVHFNNKLVAYVNTGIGPGMASTAVYGDFYFCFFEMSIRCKTQPHEYFFGSCASANCSFCENKSITCWRLSGVRLSIRFTNRHGAYAALKKPVYAAAKAWASPTC